MLSSRPTPPSHWRPRWLCAALLLSCVAPSTSHADEGMWMPAQLDQVAQALQTAGLKLPIQTLQDLDKGPLAAVINLSGCTASFVSAEGLIATNHHCAVGAIQRNSTPKANLLEAGFTAKSRADERWAGPGAHVLVTVEQVDVTALVRAAVAKVSGELAVFHAIDATKKGIVKACETAPKWRCRVATYDGGARYVRIKQLDVRDVRLVHAPPRSVGVFGGDVDNWMWPRHTGDWALFRAYVGPDGAPADHSSRNVPLKPKRWLTVNPQGVRHGSYVMVAGYPGRTYRYRLPLELAHAERVGIPRTIRILQDLVSLLETEQARAPEAKVKLTSLRAGLANYLKYSRGLLDGVRKSGASAVQAKRFAALKRWAAADADRRSRLHAPLVQLEARLETMKGQQQRAQVLGWLLRLPVLLRTASTLHWLSAQRGKPDADRDAGYQARDWKRLAGRLTHRMRSYVPAADRALFRYMLGEAMALPADARVDAADALIRQHSRGGDTSAVVGVLPGRGKRPALQARAAALDRAVASVYSAATLADPKRRDALFAADQASFERAARRADPMLRFVVALYAQRVAIDAQDKRDAGFLAAHRPVYMAALRARFGALYSDANRTLRVTYGTVRGYSPREAVHYSARTTLRGVLAKDTGKPPFDVAPALRTAALATHARVRAGQPTAPWVDRSLGSVPVNFLSTCDTTGGNSGSPTLDAQGRLVGLLFDGNYEAMASDWAFDRVLTRSIHVDVRYLLWALHDVLGGKHLLREMKLL